ncbi:MAG: hypothetical protein E6865_14110, partial [Staphylococcus lugdunensis]|nr:hypothetical protein [Staphylococcus lugdunensis]MDU2310914.1 hypothetical protein [Staphylococcus epidermidis]
NILVKLFISEIVHTEDSFLLKLYYKFNFATEPSIEYDLFIVDKDRSKISEQKFKDLIEENFERVSTDYILPCADGITFINKLKRK